MSKESICNMTQEPSIKFSDVNTDPVMEMHANGDVFWMKDGKLTKAEVDKDLAQAFLFTTQTMAGKSVEAVTNEIRKQERQRIMDKIMDEQFETLDMNDDELGEFISKVFGEGWNKELD